jgi:hypothetical protein
MKWTPHDWKVKIYLDGNETRESAEGTAEYFMDSEICDEVMLNKRGKKGYPLTFILRDATFGGKKYKRMIDDIESIGNSLKEYEVSGPKGRFVAKIHVRGKELRDKKNIIFDYLINNNKDYFMMRDLSVDTSRYDGVKRYKKNAIEIGVDDLTERDVFNMAKLIGDPSVTCEILEHAITSDDYDIIKERVFRNEIPPVGTSPETSEVPELHKTTEDKALHKTRFSRKLLDASYMSFTDNGVQKIESMKDVNYCACAIHDWLQLFKSKHPDAADMEIHYRELGSKKSYPITDDFKWKPKDDTRELDELSKDMILSLKKRKKIGKTKTSRKGKNRRKK